MYIPPIIARQRLGINVTASMNILTEVEEFLIVGECILLLYVRRIVGHVVLMESVSCQGKYHISSSPNSCFFLLYYEYSGSGYFTERRSVGSWMK
jgi:hypothetical protein